MAIEIVSCILYTIFDNVVYYFTLANGFLSLQFFFKGKLFYKHFFNIWRDKSAYTSSK